MSELVFPIAALAVTFLVLVPVLTLVSRAALARRRDRATSWSSFGAGESFAWLAAPTLAPLAWLGSAALHQSEPAREVGACQVEHATAACMDAAFLLGSLVALVVGACALRFWRDRSAWAPAPASRRDSMHVTALVSRHPELSGLRVLTARGAPAPIYTSGWLRPVVVVDSEYALAADEEVLVAALLHEREHVDGLDPLRGLIVRACLALNPAGSLLRADYTRWCDAREALCDAVAVRRGADPLALAEAIVKATRFSPTRRAPAGLAMLCGHRATTLKLRLATLLHGVDSPTSSLGHAALALALLAALAAPHTGGVGTLDLFHFEVERLLHLGR